MLAATAPADRDPTALMWIAAVGSAVIATVLVDRLLRRVLPLVVLLRLSLDFPDRAPSRMKVALRAGTLRHLDVQLARVAADGVDGSPTEAASRMLELMAALARYDRRTRGHSERVRAFTDVIADELRLAPLDRDRLRWAALLHDIGKLHVDVGILNKSGGLDDREWEAIRAHPHVGARIAEPLLPWLGEWGSAIEHHHERWDGAGYPHGVGGTDISLGARIVAVADAFEVMTAARSYKRPLSVAAARAELLRCAGEQFDPRVVRALLQASLTRLRWIVGPAALLSLVPRASSAHGAERRLGDLPLLRAGVAAVVATLSLPAVDVPFGRSETADADDRGLAVPAELAHFDALLAAAAAAGGPGPATAPAEPLPLIPEPLPIDPPAPPASAATPPAEPPAPAGGDPRPTPPRRRRPAPDGDATSSPATTSPPGALISEVARSGHGPDHGPLVADTAHTTDRPSGR